MKIRVHGTVDYTSQEYDADWFDDEGIRSRDHLKEVLIEYAEEQACINTAINEHDLDELWLAIKARKDAEK